MPIVSVVAKVKFGKTIKKPQNITKMIADSSRDLTILIISFIFSFEINDSMEIVKSLEESGLLIKGADPNIFFWKAASVTDAAAVNPNGIKMLMV